MPGLGGVAIPINGEMKSAQPAALENVTLPNTPTETVSAPVSDTDKPKEEVEIPAIKSQQTQAAESVNSTGPAPAPADPGAAVVAPVAKLAENQAQVIGEGVIEHAEASTPAGKIENFIDSLPARKDNTGKDMSFSATAETMPDGTLSISVRRVEQDSDGLDDVEAMDEAAFLGALSDGEKKGLQAVIDEARESLRTRVEAKDEKLVQEFPEQFKSAEDIDRMAKEFASGEMQYIFNAAKENENSWRKYFNKVLLPVWTTQKDSESMGKVRGMIHEANSTYAKELSNSGIAVSETYKVSQTGINRIEVNAGLEIEKKPEDVEKTLDQKRTLFGRIVGGIAALIPSSKKTGESL